MKKNSLTHILTALSVVVALTVSFGCSSKTDADQSSGKIPITTVSSVALEHFIEGRALADKVRFQEARQYFEKAVAEDPEFALAYLSLAGTQLTPKKFFESFDKAEETFLKYIDILPNDPNPYDSYAELLMKMGRHDESIENYKKAIELNPKFFFSRAGVSSNLSFLDKYKEARNVADEMLGLAADDGQRRVALMAKIVSYLHEEKTDEAYQMAQERFELAEKAGDVRAMAGDLNIIGTILLDAVNADMAMKKFDEAMAIMENSDLSEQVLVNARNGYVYNVVRVAIENNDTQLARTKANEYMKIAEERGNPNLIKAAHQLLGMVASKEENYDESVSELLQSNLQAAPNLYRLARAYAGQGDETNARKYCEMAANVNLPNSFACARVKSKADKLLISM